ncbi:MAG: hypothetical protein ACJAZ9_000244 [Neolewinella sp.]|jgi:hypothetical protein
MKAFSFLPAVALLLLASCQSVSFEDQITNDLQVTLPASHCKWLPAGAKITNVKVGKIVDIGLDGMTDVSYELDYEVKGEATHYSGAMLYIKSGGRYTLASLGGDCDERMK